MRRRRFAAALVVAILAASCGSGGSSSTKGGSTSVDAAPALTVMTRNLYLGADLEPLFTTTAADLVTTLKATYQQMVDSEVDARLAAIAAEIAAGKPDLVALQEASLWRRQPEGAAEPAVLYDFVAILLDRLASLGQTYTVASAGDGFSGGLPVEGVGTVTMQDRDVILLRQGSGVSVANPSHGTYTAHLTVSVVGLPIEVLRGWASVDVTAAGHQFRFVATHLEAYDDPSRDAQEAELLQSLDSAGLPAMVLGDFNSAATGAGSEAYTKMLDTGFKDAWQQVHPDDPGLTCCRSADLKSGSLSERIDFVLYRDNLTAQSATVVGVDDGERTAGGRWPSDHAGVLAAFALAG